MTLTGYDLSTHNIASNTDEKGLSGDFVILKASEGVSFKDSAHDGLASRARAAGIALGHYHYCHPGHNSPETEADDFVSAASPKRGETMWLDFEPYKDRTNGELKGKNLPQWVLRFKARVEDQIDGPCGIYFNGDWGDTVMNAASAAEAAEIRKMPLWKATQGASTPGRTWFWPSLTLWQWDASDGLDKDRFYGTLDTWKSLAVGAFLAPTGDDMSAEDVKAINDYTRDFLWDGFTIGGVAHPGIGRVVESNQVRINNLAADHDALVKQVEALIAKVEGLPTGGPSGPLSGTWTTGGTP